MTLDDFGVESEDPPRIRKRERVLTKHGERTLMAGWHGETNRGEMGFVSVRNSHTHRIRALNAYAISVDVLDKLDARDVSVVLIVEEDTGDVWEYDIGAFDTHVPETFLNRRDDPQRYATATRDAARGKWENHRTGVYLAADEEDADGW